MDPHDSRERIGEKSYLTVVVRLLLNKNGRVERGDVIDTDGRVEAHFSDFGGLVGAIERLISKHTRRENDGGMEEGTKES